MHLAAETRERVAACCDLGLIRGCGEDVAAASKTALKVIIPRIELPHDVHPPSLIRDDYAITWDIRGHVPHRAAGDDRLDVRARDAIPVPRPARQKALRRTAGSRRPSAQSWTLRLRPVRSRPPRWRASRCTTRVSTPSP